MGAPSASRLEVVGAQHRAHDGEEAAQDPVLVEALDGVDRLLDLPRDRVRGLGRAVAGGIEARAEQLHQRGRHARMGEQRPLHVALAERDRAPAAGSARPPAGP